MTRRRLLLASSSSSNMHNEKGPRRRPTTQTYSPPAAGSRYRPPPEQRPNTLLPTGGTVTGSVGGGCGRCTPAGASPAPCGSIPHATAPRIRGHPPTGPGADWPPWTWRRGPVPALPITAAAQPFQRAVCQFPPRSCRRQLGGLLLLAVGRRRLKAWTARARRQPP